MQFAYISQLFNLEILLPKMSNIKRSNNEELSYLPWSMLDLHQTAFIGIRAPKKASQVVLILVILSIVTPITIYSVATINSYMSRVDSARERLISNCESHSGSHIRFI